MMKQLKFWAAVALAASLTACGSEGTNDETTDNDTTATAATGTTFSRESLIADITMDEELVLNQDVTDTKTKAYANRVLQNYLTFIAAYPADTLCDDYAFKAASVAKGLGHHHQAIQLYEKIYNEYPDFDQREYCLYMVAFTYDYDLKNVEKAKAAYQKVIEEMPGHQFAIDAQVALDNLGLSDEELIKKFMEQNKEGNGGA